MAVTRNHRGGVCLRGRSLLAVVVLLGAAHADPVIRLVPETCDSSGGPPAAVVTCEPPAAPGALAFFNLAIVYDSTLLQCQSVAAADGAEAAWRFSWFQETAPSLGPTYWSAKILGRRPAGYVPGAGPRDSVLVRIIFRPVAPPGTQPYAPVWFYWGACDDNLLVKAGDPDLLVSLDVRDPTGADITSERIPPPTTAGLCDDCFGQLAVGDTTVKRQLVFESTRLALEVPTGVPEAVPTLLPSGLRLDQNYPNPFNAGTTIGFVCPPGAAWRLEIRDLLGRRVRDFSGRADGDAVAVSWDGCDRAGSPAASGIYLCRLTVGDESRARKMLLLR
ncbi:MAG TPA: T9SS type A sorting domain-containing protein [candidate division Zixibacteria bacterium]|nr:T9SS type A sorting domain-containing protein [candidate division Zixibacteria bacterium]MDD4917108.1 T9SS type A sorting domain-containing protein [candidate division Zixibacteria bacterium]MDM7972708.1 T9SS type A sorting domain-containing protein [candidate division Zixibacteria bacterium]HPI32174.1 T9SS type A sorting domain-containing protein [candidate division Zixibacteria bacterium]HPM36185.1 T9SS type A sorting domain-containing protein [candidate division Zixibacteria bacterium]